jgi:hypothetical protein
VYCASHFVSFKFYTEEDFISHHHIQDNHTGKNNSVLVKGDDKTTPKNGISTFLFDSWHRAYGSDGSKSGKTTDGKKTQSQLTDNKKDQTKNDTLVGDNGKNDTSAGDNGKNNTSTGGTGTDAQTSLSEHFTRVPHMFSSPPSSLGSICDQLGFQK